MQNYKLEVSYGEIIDKYSILDLKLKYIKDEAKLAEIRKEMQVLNENVDIQKYPFFYKLLLHINELIWLDTDTIKTLSVKNTDYNNIMLYAETSSRIFENNQKRFRLKNYFNVLQQSNINEQKSYSQNTCSIIITKEEDIYNKIAELNYLFISFDLIYIRTIYEDIIKKLFLNPNIVFTSPNHNCENGNIINILSFSIPENIKNIYDYEPIKYISGGKLGDFFNQLSVVCEKFYETGKKGILYIANVGDNFTFGLEHTYKDTYNAISNMIYIKEYSIHNGQNVDFNLSTWRENVNFQHNFKYIYSNCYNVNWGKHTWLTAKYDSKWENKMIINITPARFLTESSLIKLKNAIGNSSDYVFVSMAQSDYDYFVSNTGINIGNYIPENFDEMISIIYSCKFAYLGFSACGVIANAVKKEHILIGNYGNDFNLNNFVNDLPNVIDAFL